MIRWYVRTEDFLSLKADDVILYPTSKKGEKKMTLLKQGFVRSAQQTMLRTRLFFISHRFRLIKLSLSANSTRNTHQTCRTRPYKGGRRCGDHKNVTEGSGKFHRDAIKILHTPPPPPFKAITKDWSFFCFFERAEECVHKEGELYVLYVLYWLQWRELLPFKMFKLSPNTAPLVGGGVRYIFMPESSLWYDSLVIGL